jgi:predicted DCC family thiol-disulfide oxidoreductase YuxK
MLETFHLSGPLYPEGTLVFFDGVCLLCQNSVQALLSRNPDARLRLISLQSDPGVALLKKLGIPRDAPESILVVSGSQVFQGSEGIWHIINHLPGGWRFLGIGKIFPKWLSDAVYRLIARNRYKWFGTTETCWLPDPRWARYFLQKEEEEKLVRLLQEPTSSS